MNDLISAAQALGSALQARNWQVATAESCTGGMLAAAMTEVAGSSAWFDCGFVTYSYAAKTAQLGVSAQLLQNEGAVSEACVIAMAEGALAHSQAHISVAISGIAGPGGGLPDKPVGTVCLAWAVRGEATTATTQCFAGDRATVRQAASAWAMQGLLERCA